jgi:hypothetical protein
LDEQFKEYHQHKLQKLHGNEDEGVSWGMGFDEEEVAAY